MPTITRDSIEYAVPVLEQAIAALDKIDTKEARAAAMNLSPVLVCMRAIGGYYDEPVRRRIKSSRPRWLDSIEGAVECCRLRTRFPARSVAINLMN